MIVYWRLRKDSEQEKMDNTKNTKNTMITRKMKNNQTKVIEITDIIDAEIHEKALEPVIIAPKILRPEEPIARILENMAGNVTQPTKPNVAQPMKPNVAQPTKPNANTIPPTIQNTAGNVAQPTNPNVNKRPLMTQNMGNPTMWNTTRSPMTFMKPVPIEIYHREDDDDRNKSAHECHHGMIKDIKIIALTAKVAMEIVMREINKVATHWEQNHKIDNNTCIVSGLKYVIMNEKESAEYDKLKEEDFQQSGSIRMNGYIYEQKLNGIKESHMMINTNVNRMRPKKGLEWMMMREMYAKTIKKVTSAIEDQLGELMKDQTIIRIIIRRGMIAEFQDIALICPATLGKDEEVIIDIIDAHNVAENARKRSKKN